MLCWHPRKPKTGTESSNVRRSCEAVFCHRPKPSKVNLNLLDNLACIVGTFFSSCSVWIKVHFTLKQMWVFGFVWVTCTVPYEPPPTPYDISCTPTPTMHRWKETIRPQSSADNETWRHPHFPYFFLVCRMCCVLWFHWVVPPPPVSKFARWTLLCPAQTIPAAHLTQVLFRDGFHPFSSRLSLPFFTRS